MESTAPYVYERLVHWGDCDPAGIIYTPRAFDYVTEALEGWWREVVGIDWIALNREHMLGAPMVHASCNYIRPMAANLTVRLTVHLEKIGNSTLTFRVAAEDGDGLRYIEARFVACIMDHKTGKSTPIPGRIREIAEAYQTRCGSDG